MILRRITKHVRDQNWTAVGIDFCIVVVGVFFGIQIGNWNDDRLDRIAYQKAQTRMVVEVRSNIATAERGLEIGSPIIENFQAAIEDIRLCRTDPEARARIEDAINVLTVTISPVFRDSAISQLTQSERLLEQQSPERMERYAGYARTLNRTIAWSGKVQDKMESRSDDLHPFIDYGALLSPSDDTRIGSDRSLILSADLNEACMDHAFRKMLYDWESGHTYQLNLLRSFIDVSETYLEELGAP
ncbi:MAG: hypothetical protein AAFY84_00830 [Pseudomonadota bacterium]